MVPYNQPQDTRHGRSAENNQIQRVTGNSNKHERHTTDETESEPSRSLYRSTVDEDFEKAANGLNDHRKWRTINEDYKRAEREVDHDRQREEQSKIQSDINENVDATILLCPQSILGPNCRSFPMGISKKW